jgi:rod shape-determining protein MreC
VSRYRAGIVIAILLLILVWLVLDQAGGSNPIRDAFSRVLSPVQYALQRVAAPVFQFAGNVGRLGSMAAENETLREENSELRSEIIQLREAQIENETLRRELNFKSTVPSYQLLSAEVIGHDPNNLLEYLVIDRGVEDAIQVGMPVLTAQGLVGRISEVSAGSSKVMLITDSSSSVSALIQRSRATGMVQGYPGGELIMRYIPQGDQVQPGDIVITSGLGANFPKRLVIGQVVSVENADVQMFQEARLVTAVNLHDLEFVLVLLNFSPIDVEATPSPTSAPEDAD